MDQLYLDKLDRKVSESFRLEKSTEWQAEQDRVVDQMRAHQRADWTYYEDGFKLLELASRAYEVYSKQPVEQKNKFLKILLSNCTLERGRVLIPTKNRSTSWREGSKKGIGVCYRLRD